MTVKCLKCSKTWEKESNVWTVNDITSSVCTNCMIELVREMQKRKGYDDCFKRATELCARIECRWWSQCCEEFIK